MTNSSNIINKFKMAKRRLLLLDYDGTLVDLAATPDKARPAAEVLKALKALHEKQNTDTYLITGRSYTDIKTLLGNLNIHIIAEHGSSQILNKECKREILITMKSISAICAGSMIDEKIFSVAWHYRNSIEGYKYSRNLIHRLKYVAERHNLKIIDGNKVIEVMNESGGKGKAVRQLLMHGTYDFILAIGDDSTDEEMFEELKNNLKAITVKVGDGETVAKITLSSPKEVLQLLLEL